MYKLKILPIAKKDIDNIVSYIANNLKNPSAARNLVQKIIYEFNLILEFPYGSSIYIPLKKLNYEYRSTKVKNFLIFYTIDESKKTITIIRILYEKMNIHNII